MQTRCNKPGCEGYMYKDSVAFPPRRELTPRGEIVITIMQCATCGCTIEVEQLIPAQRIPAPERKQG